MNLKNQMKWIEPLARFGYAARGLVYLVLGILIVAGAGVSRNGSAMREAVNTLREQPFGQTLLWLLVVGLIGYVAWRLVQAAFDTDKHGTGAKGIGIRAGLFISAATYATLALYTLTLLGLVGGGTGGGDATTWLATIVGGGPGGGGQGGGGDATTWLATIVGARWVAAILCAAFAVAAIAHFVKAFGRKYADHMVVDGDKMKIIDPVSIVGLCARGAVFVALAALTFYRFRTAGGATSTPGLAEALSFIRGLPMGSILLTAMGIGLIAFALYSFIEARWRRINWEDA